MDKKEKREINRDVNDVSTLTRDIERLREYIFMCPSSLNMAENNWEEGKRIVDRIGLYSELDLIDSLLTVYVSAKQNGLDSRKILASIIKVIDKRHSNARDIILVSYNLSNHCGVLRPNLITKKDE